MGEVAMILIVVFNGTLAGSVSSTQMASQAVCKAAIEQVTKEAKDRGHRVTGVCVRVRQ